MSVTTAARRAISTQVLSQRSLRLAISFSFLLVTACVTEVPIDEWAIARAAYNSAKEAEAARYVPAIWFNGEQAYREAQKAYKERRYSDARDLFVQAKVLCEQAENAAKLAQKQAGDIIP